MTTLTWSLSSAAAQTPEYWLLFVDGSAWCSLKAPYTGAGQYSADLTQVDVPIPPGAHTVAVALVGQNTIGPQSQSVAVNIPFPVVTVVTTQQPPPPVWPAPTEVSYE